MEKSERITCKDLDSIRFEVTSKSEEELKNGYYIREYSPRQYYHYFQGIDFVPALDDKRYPHRCVFNNCTLSEFRITKTLPHSLTATKVRAAEIDEDLHRLFKIDTKSVVQTFTFNTQTLSTDSWLVQYLKSNEATSIILFSGVIIKCSIIEVKQIRSLTLDGCNIPSDVEWRLKTGCETLSLKNLHVNGLLKFRNDVRISKTNRKIYTIDINTVDGEDDDSVLHIENFAVQKLSINSFEFPGKLVMRDVKDVQSLTLYCFQVNKWIIKDSELNRARSLIYDYKCDSLWYSNVAFPVRLSDYIIPRKVYAEQLMKFAGIMESHARLNGDNPLAAKWKVLQLQAMNKALAVSNLEWEPFRWTPIKLKPLIAKVLSGLLHFLKKAKAFITSNGPLPWIKTDTLPPRYWEEKLNLSLSEFLSDFGQSWTRPLWALIYIGLIFYPLHLLIMMDEIIIQRHVLNDLSGYIFMKFIEFLSPFRNINYLDIQSASYSEWAGFYLLDYISRALQGFAIFHFLRSTRKFLGS